ncbi:hypothetical protein IJJ18_01675 [Candidatus Saccharibacteria bacterium]|nr:hypothetical protein [Candidatus Saccharibacteria bacterium]
MKDQLLKSKKGAAAFYVVIFTTLLISVITMSFIRIMISEAVKSTNDDLSKSAYDSALAGVEDAKIALVRYHRCLDQGYTAKANGNACEKIIAYMQGQGCDTVSKVLNRNNGAGGEVRVKEGSLNDGNSVEMEQAYTCVKISEDLADYRSQVNSSNRVRIIPLRTEDISAVTGIEFKWLSTSNKEQTAGIDKFPTRDKLNNQIPPVMVDIYQTDVDFSLGEISVNNDGNNGTDRASLLLKPVLNAKNYITPIKSTQVVNASNKINNPPFNVNCNNELDFKCQSRIAFPETYRNGQRNKTTAFLRVELPYGQPEADFSIKLCTGDASGNLEHMCDTTVSFLGVQAQIDSTGRANDLFRRVEARVELIDTNFPYPEFAVQLTGDSDENIEKNFWVTRNCWSSDEYDASECSNTGDVIVSGSSYI